jgi:hypothetical protein
MAMTVVQMPMKKLLTSARPKWLPSCVENAARKLSSVMWVG